MAQKRYSEEGILKLPREIELKLADGDDVQTACRGVGVSDAPYCNWRRRSGGMPCPAGHQAAMSRDLKDSSIIRLRPTQPNHVWSVEFGHDRLSNGRSKKDADGSG